MEFLPAGWEIFNTEDFETAAPRVAGDAVMELMAQIRPNGRVMDHWRVAIGGAKILEADFRLSTICKSSVLSPYKLRFQTWPKDIRIRRNMNSSTWTDGLETLARREFAVTVKDDPDTDRTEELLVAIEKEAEMAKKSFSFWYAVAIGEDKRLILELQGLPGSVATLTSKPAFTG